MVACVGVFAVVVMVSVATAAATSTTPPTTPKKKVLLPLAIIGQPVLTQATKGSPSVSKPQS